MTEAISLNQTEIGQTLLVERLENESAMRRRLEDLGLTVGTRVRCLMASPLGDPRAYAIRGAVIALRQRDAAYVFGRPDDKDGGESLGT